MKNNKGKIVVGLSGGVDSSVALVLLKKQGYQPIGVSFKYNIWKSSKNQLKQNACCSAESLAIAKKVCQKLKVPHYIIDKKLDFKKKVMEYFLLSLQKNETPNPCIICNRLMKFNHLSQFAKKMKAEYLATGHYARIKKAKDGKYQLLKAKDKEKDQSYFLCLLEEKELKKIIFPLGNYFKKEVYQIAKKAGINFFTKKKQSQDLCFVSAKSLKAYLENKIGIKEGDIVDNQGNILGKHQGLHFYTLGQRKGIKLSGGPWKVVKKDSQKNQLVVTNQKNDADFSTKEAFLSDVHFISGKFPQKAMKIQVKTRFVQKPVLAKLSIEKKQNRGKLFFNKPQYSITPGQWAVFYQKDVCLGGGILKDDGNK